MNEFCYRLMDSIQRVVIIVSLAILGYLAVETVGRYAGFKVWRVSGESMMPTLQDGDIQLNYDSGDWNYGDIVCIESPTKNGDFWVKRVVGLPGDTVEVWGNYIEVNGVADPISKNYEKSYTESTVTVLLYGEYFVSGDNRKVSFDSRYVGPIQEENILSEKLFSF